MTDVNDSDAYQRSRLLDAACQAGSPFAVRGHWHGQHADAGCGCVGFKRTCTLLSDANRIDRELIAADAKPHHANSMDAGDCRLLWREENKPAVFNLPGCTEALLAFALQPYEGVEKCLVNMRQLTPMKLQITSIATAPHIGRFYSPNCWWYILDAVAMPITCNTSSGRSVGQTATTRRHRAQVEGNRTTVRWDAGISSALIQVSNESKALAHVKQNGEGINRHA